MGSTFFMRIGGSGGRGGQIYSPNLMSSLIYKSNDWFYKPGSLAAGGTGRTCSRGILRAVKRRT